MLFRFGENCIGKLSYAWFYTQIRKTMSYLSVENALHVFINKNNSTYYYVIQIKLVIKSKSKYDEIFGLQQLY